MKRIGAIRLVTLLVLLLSLLTIESWAAPIRGLSPRTTFLEGTESRAFGLGVAYVPVAPIMSFCGRGGI